MSFDFTLEPRTVEWQERIRAFVAGTVIPCEQEAFVAGVSDHLRVELQGEARAAGIWAPQVPRELGGGGFAFDQAAVLLEEAGTSLLGPLALNCAAPDEGTIHLLTHVATPEQKERYLLPLVAGTIRSCFAMTEPAPGAGSDPTALRTVATRAESGWILTGEKHLITGADGAGFTIVMAAGGPHGDTGSTMFIVDSDTKGPRSEITFGRSIPRLSVAIVTSNSRTSSCQTRTSSGSRARASDMPRSD